MDLRREFHASVAIKVNIDESFLEFSSLLCNIKMLNIKNFFLCLKVLQCCSA